MYMLRQTLLFPVFSLFHCLRQSYRIQTTLKRWRKMALNSWSSFLPSAGNTLWMPPDLFLHGAGAQAQSLSHDRQVPYQLYPKPSFFCFFRTLLFLFTRRKIQCFRWFPLANTCSRHVSQRSQFFSREWGCVGEVSLVLIDLVPEVLKCAETSPACWSGFLPSRTHTHTQARVHHICR